MVFTLAALMLSGCQPTIQFSSVLGDLDIPAEIYRPRAGGRTPAVVLLGPCTGVASYMRDWAEALNAEGYAVLLVDSYAARLTRNACHAGASPLVDDVALDAVAGMQYLAGLPWIDPERIAVMGWSHGASAALFVEPLAAFYHAPSARAVVSVYPGCETLGPDVQTPTLLLLAGRDDWTPPRACIRLGSMLQAKGLPLSYTMYPEASHGYDQPGRLRTYLGHRMVYDESAASDSHLQVSRFLAEQFRAKR